MADDYLIYPKNPTKPTVAQLAMRRIQAKINGKPHPSVFVSVLAAASVDRSKPQPNPVPRALKVR